MDKVSLARKLLLKTGKRTHVKCSHGKPIPGSCAKCDANLKGPK